jgi:aminopeptidase N
VVGGWSSLVSSHLLVDKSHHLEAAFGGVHLDAGRAFAEPGAQPRYAGDRDARIERIEVDLHVDPRAPGLRGRAAVHLRPIVGALGAVHLDLDGVEVGGVVDGDGRPLRWSHRDGRLRVEGLPPGGGVAVVDYAGLPPRGLYFTGPTAAEPDRQHMAWTQCQDEDGHFLVPCQDQPGVKHPWRVRIHAPPGFQTVGNGRLVARDGDAWTWEVEQPIPAYLLTVVVGELAVVEDEGASVPVRYLAPAGGPSDEATLRRVFGRTPAMIRALEEEFGRPYPWPRYDQVVVHDFIFGGMENAGATTLTDLVLTDARAAIDWDSDDLIVHELAHQWFGDLLTCQDWSQGWLNEGWATWTEHLWKVRADGQDEGDYGLWNHLGNYLDEDGSRYRRPIVSYLYRAPIDLFDRHLYEKGALVLHTLRTVLGAEAFRAGVGLYLDRHAFQSVHTRHFQRAMEDASGRNLDGFFQQWVEGAGHPELEVELSWARGLLTAAVTQKQSGPGVAEAFAFPLELRVVGASGEQRVVLPIAERARSFALAVAEEPLHVEVDPGFRFLSALSVKAPRSWSEAALRGGSTAIARIRAARSLGEEGSAAAVRALSDALRVEPFWGARVEVAGVLGKRGGASARDALLGAVGDAHPKVRRAVVAQLGAFRDEVTRRALLAKHAEGDASLQVEAEVVRVLGRIRAPETLALAEELLGRDAWGEVYRTRALEALGACQDPAALPILLAWTAEDKSTRARAAAASALGRLADELPDTRRAAVDRLVQLAVESPFRLRLAAVAALGQAGDPRGMGALRQVHDSGQDGRVQRQAYEALARLGKGKDGAQALGTLRKDSEELREQVQKLRDRLDKVEGPRPTTDA